MEAVTSSTNAVPQRSRLWLCYFSHQQMELGSISSNITHRFLLLPWLLQWVRFAHQLNNTVSINILSEIKKNPDKMWHVYMNSSLDVLLQWDFRFVFIYEISSFLIMTIWHGELGFSLQFWQNIIFTAVIQKPFPSYQHLPAGKDGRAVCPAQPVFWQLATGHTKLDVSPWFKKHNVWHLSDIITEKRVDEDRPRNQAQLDRS